MQITSSQSAATRRSLIPILMEEDFESVYAGAGEGGDWFPTVDTTGFNLVMVGYGLTVVAAAATAGLLAGALVVLGAGAAAFAYVYDADKNALEKLPPIDFGNGQGWDSVSTVDPTIGASVLSTYGFGASYLGGGGGGVMHYSIEME